MKQATHRASDPPPGSFWDLAHCVERYFGRRPPDELGLTRWKQAPARRTFTDREAR